MPRCARIADRYEHCQQYQADDSWPPCPSKVVASCRRAKFTHQLRTCFSAEGERPRCTTCNHRASCVRPDWDTHSQNMGDQKLAVWCELREDKMDPPIDVPMNIDNL